MRCFVLIASIALVAVFSQVSSDDPTEDLQKSLGITDAELKDRLELVSKIEKLEIWGVMTVVQQERLRQAIVLGTKPPLAWNILTSYDKILLPENANFLWRLVHLEPLVRNVFINALPALPHEPNAEAASKKAWFKSLTETEQRELTRLILTEKDIPEGFDSWKDAIADDQKVQDWLKTNKDKLQPTEERATKLEDIIGITKKERADREELFSKVKKLQIYSVITPTQQERLRQAIILDKPRPLAWNILTTYDKIILPQNQAFIWRLTNWEPHLRDLFMNALPTVNHEDVLEKAQKADWWFTVGNQKELGRNILTEKKVPEGWETWQAAINDPKFNDWVKNNGDKIGA